MYVCMAGQSLEEELDHVLYSLVHVFVPFQRNGQQYKVVCMCMCMYVCMYVCTCEYMYVCIWVCIYEYHYYKEGLCMNKYGCKYVCMYVCMHVFILISLKIVKPPQNHIFHCGKK